MSERLVIATIRPLPDSTPTIDVPADLTVGLDADAQFYASRGLDYIFSAIQETFKDVLKEAEISGIAKFASKKIPDSISLNSLLADELPENILYSF